MFRLTQRLMRGSGGRRAVLAVLAVSMFWLHAIGLGEARADEALWAALRQPGHFVLMRHALAPGGGDPANFRLEDCGTQRNLSDAGRAQARRTGEAFQARGIAEAAVFSSQWCRCLETARLLGLGDVTPLPSLNSFFGDRTQGPAYIEQLRRDLAALDLSRPAMLVTHQVTITGFAGVFPASGEMVVMRRKPNGGFETLGRLAPVPTAQ